MVDSGPARGPAVSQPACTRRHRHLLSADRLPGRDGVYDLIVAPLILPTGTEAEVAWVKVVLEIPPVTFALVHFSVRPAVTSLNDAAPAEAVNRPPGAIVHLVLAAWATPVFMTSPAHRPVAVWMDGSGGFGDRLRGRDAVRALEEPFVTDLEDAEAAFHGPAGERVRGRGA